MIFQAKLCFIELRAFFHERNSKDLDVAPLTNPFNLGKVATPLMDLFRSTQRKQ